MKTNVSILTSSAQDAVTQGVGDYQNAVAAHVGGDWAQHTQFHGSLAFTSPVTGNAIVGAGSMRVLLSGTNSDGTGDGIFTFPVIDTGNPVANSSNAPFILAQPQALTVVAGTAASFYISAASGSPLSYQWLKDGVAIDGATSSVYVVAAAATTDEGSYAVSVSNQYGSTVSAGATLTVQ